MGLGWFLTGAVFSVFVSPIILGDPENSFKVIHDFFENFVKVVGAVS